jgi:hypothetical protein
MAAADQVLYARQSAEEAAKASKAAADQVELQRPRPIVIAKFICYFGENRGNMTADDKELLLRNIGDSPAFDVNVSALQTPGSVQELGVPSNLKTDSLLWLAPSIDLTPCVHYLEPPRGFRNALGIGALFVKDAKSFFDNQSINDQSNNPDSRYEIPFTVSYRSLDGRKFEQPHLLVIRSPHAWVEAVGSLLESSARAERA